MVKVLFLVIIFAFHFVNRENGIYIFGGIYTDCIAALPLPLELDVD